MTIAGVVATATGETMGRAANTSRPARTFRRLLAELPGM